MKQTFLCFLIVLSGVLFTGFSRADLVTILSDEWYPINGQPNSSHPGYMIEIAQEILAANGHQLDYRLAPWKRSILEVRRGNADCIIGAYKSDAPDFLFPEQAWGKAEFNFYTRSDSAWQFNGLTELSSQYLGVISGYAYSPTLDRYIEQNKDSDKVQLVSGEQALEKNIRKLLANRLDVIIAFKPVLNQKLTEMKLQDEIRFAGRLESAQDLFIACSPKKASSQYFIKLFSQGLTELKSKGRLQAILKKYKIEEF